MSVKVRMAPSPTGFLHIGGVYVATIDVDVARHSGGRYLVRLEDTDQARITEGAAEQFAEAFAYFSIGPDETDQTGRYGPLIWTLLRVAGGATVLAGLVWIGLALRRERRRAAR